MCLHFSCGQDFLESKVVYLVATYPFVRGRGHITGWLGSSALLVKCPQNKTRAPWHGPALLPHLSSPSLWLSSAPAPTPTPPSSCWPQNLCTCCSLCLELSTLVLHTRAPPLHSGLNSNVTSSERLSITTLAAFVGPFPQLNHSYHTLFLFFMLLTTIWKFFRTL